MDLMPRYQIISGFSDIKSEIRTKTRTPRAQNDLRLWFSLTEGSLYAHDFNEHKYCVLIAYKSYDYWVVRLDTKIYGHKLIYKAVTEYKENEIIKKLHRLYESYGTYTYF
jgi:hypothetical protein